MICWIYKGCLRLYLVSTATYETICGVICTVRLYLTCVYTHMFLWGNHTLFYFQIRTPPNVLLLHTYLFRRTPISLFVCLYAHIDVFTFVFICAHLFVWPRMCGLLCVDTCSSIYLIGYLHICQDLIFHLFICLLELVDKYLAVQYSPTFLYGTCSFMGLSRYPTFI